MIRPNNTPGTYSVVELKGGIGVVAIDDVGRLLLVGQYRYPVGAYSWEIPKGAFDSFGHCDNPLDTAKRELREETGYVGGEWNSLGRVHTLLGSTDDEVHLFKAERLEPGPAQPEGVEIIKVQWVTESIFWEMVEKGEITDATSIAAVAMSRRRHELLQGDVSC